VAALKIFFTDRALRELREVLGFAGSSTFRTSTPFMSSA